MPQDIPVEASETLAFTPPSLASREHPPVFTLCAPTGREKRYRRRLMLREGVAHHSDEQLREESLRGLRALWGEDAYADHAGRVRVYWAARDDYLLAAKLEPDLAFTFDAEEEARVLKLMENVRRHWPPLADMAADNADAQEVTASATVAVVVKGWSGLTVEPVSDDGYLTLDCVDRLAVALRQMDELAFMELMVACMNRMSLEPAMEKNSASPPPTEPDQASSKAAASSAPKSPMSAKSARKTSRC